MFHPFMLAGLAVVGLAAFTDAGQDAAAALVATISGRGRRVGPKTTPDALGVIRQDPQGLADAAAVDLEVYALSRMLSSEHGNDGPLYKLAVGWAAVNHAGGGGRVARALLAGRGDTDGFFKRQNARYLSGGEEHSAGVYASTARDPYEDDVQIATAILSGQVPDPTGGATNFLSPSGFGDDARAAAVIAKWEAGGLERVAVDGIDSDRLTLFRRGGSANG